MVLKDGDDITQPTPTNDQITIVGAAEYNEILAGEVRKILAMVSLDSPLPRDDNSRAGLDVSLVVDVSGSMSGNMNLMKDTLQFVVQQLSSNDTLSLITFSDKVDVVFGTSKMDSSNKAKVRESIKAMKARGSTNLSGGLLSGISQMIELKKRKPDVEVRRVEAVLLFTDGEANLGITGTPEIIAAAKSATQEVADCAIFTFGYGANHSESLLRGLADGTENGMYYFISDPDKIPESFVDCFGGLLSVMGQNVSLAISPLNGVVVREFLSDYKITTNEETGVVTAQLNDIYAEEHRDILFYVEIPPNTPTGTDDLPVVEFNLNFFDVQTNAFANIKKTILVKVVETLSENLLPNIEINAHHNEVITAQAMEKARSQANTGNFDSAQTILRSALTTVVTSPSKDSPSSLKMIAELNESIADVQNERSYNAGSKKMALKAKQISKQKQCSAMSKKQEMMRAYERQNRADQLAKQPGAVKFTFGNEHENVPADKAKPSRSDPTMLCLHKWTAFINCAVPELIEKVTFTVSRFLHFYQF